MLDTLLDIELEQRADQPDCHQGGRGSEKRDKFRLQTTKFHHFVNEIYLYSLLSPLYSLKCSAAHLLDLVRL